MSRERLFPLAGERRLSRRSLLRGGVLLAGGAALTGCGDSLSPGSRKNGSPSPYDYEQGAESLDPYGIVSKDLLDSDTPTGGEALRLANLIIGRRSDTGLKLAAGALMVAQHADKRPGNYSVLMPTVSLANGNSESDCVVTDSAAIPDGFLTASVGIRKNQLSSVLVAVQTTPVTDLDSLRSGYALLLTRSMNPDHSVRWDVADQSRYGAAGYEPPKDWPGRQPYDVTDLPTVDLSLLTAVNSWEKNAAEMMLAHVPHL